MKIQSSEFGPGEPMPVRYTADGDNLSPPLSWSDIPGDMSEFALICEDPDASTDQPWVHWVICKIPPQSDGLPQALVPASAQMQANAMQGRNSWGILGYRGPDPSKGHGVHHYQFNLYALDTPLMSIKPGYETPALLSAMEGHILAEAQLIGTYER